MPDFEAISRVAKIAGQLAHQINNLQINNAASAAAKFMSSGSNSILAPESVHRTRRIWRTRIIDEAVGAPFFAGIAANDTPAALISRQNAAPSSSS